MNNSGGCAFPLAWIEVNEHGTEFTNAHGGMTLRDWFAGQALAGIVSENYKGGGGSQSYNTKENISFAAYRLADAMLAELSK